MPGQLPTRRAGEDSAHDGRAEVIRLYVAAYAERVAPLFVGLRAGVHGRAADLDFYAASMRDLWYVDRPRVDAVERVGLLERFPELQPHEDVGPRLGKCC